MKKQILPLIAIVLISLTMLCPLAVQAVTPLDPDANASLTLHYQKDGNAFSDLPIGIYRVAEASPDGSLDLIDPFASYPINIYGITTQEQWHLVAQTLCSYLVANQVEPDHEAKTDINGTVLFPSLDTGLYFVREAVAKNDSGTYIFNQFMVYVPTPQPDGTFNYAVEAIPKCTNFVPRTQYTVTMLWMDAGYQHMRPKDATVDIYKNGVLQETQLLNADNDWTYRWYATGEEHEKWTVMSESIPDFYEVTMQENSNHYLIINTCQTTPEIPATGDSFSPLPWILLFCFSGIMLVILGLYIRRR